MRWCLLLLLSLSCGAAAQPALDGYSSDAIRRRAEEQDRRREAWWARERERQQAARVDRELERRRDASGRQIERWEEQREIRRWGRREP